MKEGCIVADRQFHLSRLVRVKGVCTRRTAVYPQLDMVKFDCLKCNYVIGPLVQNSDTEVKPRTCPACQKDGPFQVLPLLESLTFYSIVCNLQMFEDNTLLRYSS